MTNKDLISLDEPEAERRAVDVAEVAKQPCVFSEADMQRYFSHQKEPSQSDDDCSGAGKETQHQLRILSRQPFDQTPSPQSRWPLFWQAALSAEVERSKSCRKPASVISKLVRALAPWNVA